MDRIPISVTPDIPYGSRHGVQLSFDVYAPPDANGAAVLFINSGGFISGQLVQYAKTGPSEYRFLEPTELATQGASPPIPLLAQFSFRGLLNAGFRVFAPHAAPQGMCSLLWEQGPGGRVEDPWSIDSAPTMR